MCNLADSHWHVQLGRQLPTSSPKAWGYWPHSPTHTSVPIYSPLQPYDTIQGNDFSHCPCMCPQKVLEWCLVSWLPVVIQCTLFCVAGYQPKENTAFQSTAVQYIVTLSKTKNHIVLTVKDVKQCTVCRSAFHKDTTCNKNYVLT